MTSKGKVLFVDDEKRVLNSMRGLFRRDYELYLTTDGSEAVKLVAEHDIDVIVADQRMPGLTGVQVLGEIRQVSPRTVRILLTGYADPEAIEGSINVGEVFRFLSKPCQPKLLKETLKLAITAARATSGAAAASGGATTGTAVQPADTPTPGPPIPAPEPTPAPNQALAAGAANNVTPITAATASAGEQDDSPPTPARSVTHWENRTEIVMSGDSCQELGQSELAQKTDTELSNVGVAVFTINPSFAESAMRTISMDRSAILATTLVKVAEILEERLAGVLITDFTSDIGLLQNMIGTLKQHLPELVTIVVSENRDTSDMINLINYGQVFRYVEKPIDPNAMRTDVNAAALKHLQLLEYPELIQRHQVFSLSAPAEVSPTLDQFVGKVTRLRGRWTNTNDKSH